MKHNRLIWVAIGGLLVVIILLVASMGQRQSMLLENGETRQSVEESLDRLLPAQITSAEDQGLLSVAKTLTGAPYVARVWVVGRDGRVVFHQGGPGKVGDPVRDISGQNGRSLVAALSADEFSGAQAVQVYTAAALMVEGDHNDVFRPLVRPLKNANGEITAVIGLSYDVSSAVSAVSLTDILRVILFFLGLAAYWLCLPAWVYLDARDRGEPAVLWAVFVFIANLVGLVAYLIVISRTRLVGQAGS